MSNVYRNIPSSFGEATAKLRGRDDMSLGYETRLWTDGDAIHLRHHATNIVSYYPDDSFTIRTGGWYSSTTKRRINAALAGMCMGLSSIRGEWSYHTWGRDNQNTLDFANGDNIRRVGNDFEVK